MMNNTPQLVTLLQAVNLALHRAMQGNNDVVVLGEDIAVNGGVFRATEGLLQSFGPKRVIDTPLAESLIAGMAVGMSTQGMRPVAEFQFSGFIYPAMDHIINHAARMRHRTRSRLSCPLVFRAPFGGGIHAPEHHSESLEAIFAHIPGLKVVIPSSPKAAYGLLLAAIQSNDPVLFLEPKRIYRSLKEEVIDNGAHWELDKCRQLMFGNDVTLISWGASLIETMDAAKLLAKKNIGCDVIDLMSIKPIDYIPLLESVKKTGRCVVLHEAAKTAGLGAEIIATINEQAFKFLKAPTLRITGYDTVVPYAATEKYYYPSAQSIEQKILQHFNLG